MTNGWIMNRVKLGVLLILGLIANAWFLSHGHAATPARAGAAHETQLVLPDIMVRDSFDHEQSLSHLLKDQVAVVNFVFTSCTTVCPILSATMQELEKRLQHRLGSGVILLSISVDPGNDTPQKLRAHAEKLGAGIHWHWLTGKPAEITQLLKAFSVPTGRPENHPPLVLIGNVNTDRWLRWVGIAAPQTLVDAVDMLAAETK